MLSSHQRQQEDPEYDYVTNGTENNSREKVAYDSVQRIELRANVAYKPVEHWFSNLPSSNPLTYLVYIFTHFIVSVSVVV